MIPRAAWLRLKQESGTLAVLALILGGAACFDVRLRSFNDGMPSFTLGFAMIMGLVVAAAMLDTTRADRHLEFLERFPLARGAAWAIDALVAAVVLLVALSAASLALMAGLALDGRPPEPWSIPAGIGDMTLTLVGAAVLAAGAGVMASAATRRAFGQLLAGIVALIAAGIGAFALLAWWDMSPGLRDLAVPSMVVGLLLGACGLGMRCVAPPHVARRRRRILAMALAAALGTAIVLAATTIAALSWRRLPRHPRVEQIHLGDALAEASERLYVEVKAEPSGVHEVLLDAERPGGWRDLGRSLHPQDADPADPARRLFRLSRLHGALRELPVAWLASGDDEARDLELLFPLQRKVDGRWRWGQTPEPSADGRFFAGIEAEQGEDDVPRVNHAVIRARDGSVLRDVELLARSYGLASATPDGFEVGAVADGSHPDLVVDLLVDPATGEERRIERPRRWLAHDAATHRWLFERSESDGEMTCPSLVVRDASAATERVVLGREMLGCHPATARPQGPEADADPTWFARVVGGRNVTGAPCVAIDDTFTRAAVLLPEIDGPWLALRLIAVDLATGAARTLLPPEKLPRESALEATSSSRRGALRGMRRDVVAWEHPAGIDVVDWETGTTRPLMRWSEASAPLRRRGDSWVSPGGLTAVTLQAVTQDRITTWRVETWASGATRLLHEATEPIDDLRFVDDERVLVVERRRVLLLGIDGSRPQVLFP